MAGRRGRGGGFYTELFGWEAEGRRPARRAVLMCRLRGRDVAGVGAAGPAAAAWTTYVWVESADATAAAAAEHGGAS